MCTAASDTPRRVWRRAAALGREGEERGEEYARPPQPSPPLAVGAAGADGALSPQPSDVGCRRRALARAASFHRSVLWVLSVVEPEDLARRRSKAVPGREQPRDAPRLWEGWAVAAPQRDLLGRPAHANRRRARHRGGRRARLTTAAAHQPAARTRYDRRGTLRAIMCANALARRRVGVRGAACEDRSVIVRTHQIITSWLTLVTLNYIALYCITLHYVT